MPRAAAVLAVVLLEATLFAAPARAATFELPKLFSKQVRAIKAKTNVPVLLPQRYRYERRRLYPSGSARRGGWTLDLGAAPRCGGATACFVASFTAWRRERPHFRRRVRLVGGRTGYFKPTTCGASCSPPAIEWRWRDALYSVQARVGAERTERRELIALVNSAIRHGPR